MEKTYSKRIAKALDDFFEENDWHPEFDPEFGFYNFRIHLDCKLQNARCLINVRDDCFLVYAICPIKADHQGSADDERTQ